MNTAKGANCKVIIVANQKGGVAKSASAVNLSAALAKLGKKVLMIDADSQGTGSNMFGIDDVDSIDVTLATILEKIINDEDTWYQIAVALGISVAIVWAPGFITEFVGEGIMFLKRALNELAI